MIDAEITAKVDEIAVVLEEKAGIDPGASARDTTLAARLDRIKLSLDSGALEAHKLAGHLDVDPLLNPVTDDLLQWSGTQWISSTIGIDDLNDATITSPSTAQFLRFNGTAWVNAALVLGDLPTINLDDLNDVTIATPASAQVLRYNGSNWANAALVLADLPLIGLDDLSDVVITSVMTDDLFSYDGADWVNIAKATLIWADGTIPLTADWNAGVFKITAEKLRALRTGSGAFNTIEAELAATGITGTDSAIYNIFDILVNYEFNDGAALMLPTINGLNMDFNITKTAASLEAGKYRAINIDMDFTSIGVTQPAIIIDAAAPDSGASFGNAMMTVSARTLNSSGVTALRTEAFVGSASASSLSSAVGYLGFSDGAGTYTGNLIGVRGLTNNSDAANSIIAVLGDPVFLTTTLAKDKILAVKAFGGHMMVSNGSLEVVVSGTRFGTPNTDITSTHLDFVNNNGELYVEGNAEFDGTLFMDGDLDHNGTNIGFFGTTPVVQASAYTPTNVSTDRSYDANSTTLDELADILGTLIVDLQAYGLLQ